VTTDRAPLRIQCPRCLQEGERVKAFLWADDVIDCRRCGIFDRPRDLDAEVAELLKRATT
jgi:uncharacterized protein (DUF983 family)